MRKFENNNQQKEKTKPDQIETVFENDPFSPENNLEDIKNEAVNRGEVLINESFDKLNKNFEYFSEIIGPDLQSHTELEVIKSETEHDILSQNSTFQVEIEAVIPKIDSDGNILENSLDEKQDKELNRPELILSLIKDAYAKINFYEKELKNCSNKDAGSQELLQQWLAENKSLLENSETAYKNMLGDRVKESFQNKPGMTPVRALNEIIVPGLSILEKEKAAALPAKDFRIFQKGLDAINFYMPQGKVARTLTVAGIMTIASLALSSAPTVGVAVYLGCKLGRSLVGSYVGEKVSNIVEKQIDKHAEKKKEEDIEKINFSHEDINNSVNKLIELGGKNLKSQKNQAMLKNFAKISTHIAVAGVTVSSLEIAELGLNSFSSGGAELNNVAGSSFKTLAAQTFFACSKDVVQDMVADKVIDKVIDKAATNNTHKRIVQNYSKLNS